MNQNKDRINTLNTEIYELQYEIKKREDELNQLILESNEEYPLPYVTNNSSPLDKVKLYRSLFRGREDVYASRFESQKSGKSGYQPVCQNEWIQGVCYKPRIKCQNCDNQNYQNISNEIIQNHLKGGILKPFVMGIYPLMLDETCWFLAIDFDKTTWQQDASAFLKTCSKESIPAYLERSRSGNGGHVWIFFEEPVSAKIARNMGSSLITRTLDRRTEIGLDSFDRFFPNQDTIPKGGFGNLIALPLQKKAREKNHSLFIDENFLPYKDQWSFLSNIKRIGKNRIEKYVDTAIMNKEILPVTDRISDKEADTPWIKIPKSKFPVIDSSLPQKIDIVLSNQIFIESAGLPPVLINRILRLASFSNPDFYQAQALRLSTWNKPRILYCFEQFPQHLALPIGCYEDLLSILDHYNINPNVDDKRNRGKLLQVEFYGELHPEQLTAAKALLQHENGVLSATTAFGKTVIALWLISMRKVNTLILVHRKQLQDQWVERIEQFLGIPKKEIGRFGGGRKKRNGLIDVAVIQSVNKKGEIEDWISEYGQIIVDECHHISSFSFEQTIRQSNALYKCGLSATLTRKDGQHPIIFMNLGKIRYNVSARKEARKRNFEHLVVTRQTEFITQSQIDFSKNIQDLFKEVYLDKSRNKAIVLDIKTAYSSNRQILVLSERTEHLQILLELMKNGITNLFVLKGGLGKKKLKTIMSDLNNVVEGEGLVILATGKYLGEGFDLPALNTLFLTFPVSWKGTLTQYAGRLHRDHHAKTEVIIYDYLDQNIPVLVRMYNKRLKGYSSLGYQVD